MAKTKTGTKIISDALVSRHKMNFWLENKWNVLFKGKHGVGKTALILKAFKRAGLRYLYFSGATMDPYIDFIGVPVRYVNPKTKVTSIELLRPSHIMKKNVQAIFFDEFNRTHKKIRNAVMELLQFKTINGQPISSDLQVIWAAINPDDDESTYDVDSLDPAQQDRFQVQIDLPYRCSSSYFEAKYGKHGVIAVQFWDRLDEKLKDKISPRRLDYALATYAAKGDIRDVLPVETNTSRLLQLLEGNGYKDLEDLLDDFDKAEAFFADENNYTMYVTEIFKSKKLFPLFDVLSDEKITALLSRMDARSFVLRRHIRRSINRNVGSLYLPMLREIVNAGQNNKLKEWATNVINDHELKIPGKSVVKGQPVHHSAKMQGINAVILAVFHASAKTANVKGVPVRISVNWLKNVIAKNTGQKIKYTKTLVNRVAALNSRHKIGITFVEKKSSSGTVIGWKVL